MRQYTDEGIMMSRRLSCVHLEMQLVYKSTTYKSTTIVMLSNQTYFHVPSKRWLFVLTDFKMNDQ